MAGLVLTWSRRRELWFLYGWLLITTGAVAVFVVFARYRFPLVPVLMMFASAFVVTAVRLVRRREAGGLMRAAVALTVAAIAANWEIHAPRQPARAGYNNHCIILMEQSRPQDALAEAERALDRYPGDPLAHLSAGAALTELKRVDEALGHLGRARAASPKMPEVHRCLGNAYVAAGRPEEAIEHYRQGLKLDPEDFRGLNGLAAVVAQLGRPGEAVELIRRAFEVQPTYAKGYLNLGNAYLMMNRVDEAVAAYREALRLKPDFRDALYNLGVVELQRGRPEAAIEPLRGALAAGPERREARLALATALVEAGHLSEACALVQPVLAEEPVVIDANLVHVVSRLAWVLATSPDPAERDGVRALSLARRACRLTDNAVPSLLRASAAALAEIGRFDQAVVGAKLAIERAQEFGQGDLVEKIRTELASYEAGQPVRSTPQTAESPGPS
jgi:tetratricopeptide (TPR) repeat protein